MSNLKNSEIPIPDLTDRQADTYTGIFARAFVEQILTRIETQHSLTEIQKAQYRSMLLYRADQLAPKQRDENNAIAVERAAAVERLVGYTHITLGEGSQLNSIVQD